MGWFIGIGLVAMAGLVLAVVCRGHEIRFWRRKAHGELARCANLTAVIEDQAADLAELDRRCVALTKALDVEQVRNTALEMKLSRANSHIERLEVRLAAAKAQSAEQSTLQGRAL